RAYDESNVQTLRFIRRARELGFSLQEIDKLLALYRNRRRASEHVKRLALAHVAELDHKIAELTRIRDTLAELARHCRGISGRSARFWKSSSARGRSRSRRPYSERDGSPPEL